MTAKKHLLPMGLLVGEAAPRKKDSPWMVTEVEMTVLREFAGQEAHDHMHACRAAEQATSTGERVALVNAAREHARRLQYLNLHIRMRGGLPVTGPAVRVL